MKIVSTALLLAIFSVLAGIQPATTQGSSPPVPDTTNQGHITAAVKGESVAAKTESSRQSIDEIIAEFTAADTLVQEQGILPIYDRLFSLAYATAPEIRIARKLLIQKDQQRYTAAAQRYSPKVDARLSQVREFNQEDNATSNGAGEAQQPSSFQDGEEYPDWSFSLDAPIYRRSLSVNLNIADTERDLAANNLKIKTQELDLRLKELLANYLLSSYRLLNIYNSVKLSREHVDRIYRGYELRDQTRLQLLRAQANLKELEARKDLSEHEKEVALRALLDFTGLNPDQSVFLDLENLLTSEIRVAGCINTLADSDEKYAKIQKFIESMDNEGRRLFFETNSSLYTKILLERTLGEHQATAFTQAEYPDLSVRGYYSRHEDTQFTKFNGEGSLALVLSVPLFTGGTIFSTNKAQAAAQHIAGLTQYADLRTALYTIENNRKLITSLRSIYTTQQINLHQQQEIVVLSVKSYSIKQTSMQDLLTSQNRLIDAKNALMQTTTRLAALYRQFAWEIGTPFDLPEIDGSLENAATIN